MKKVILALVIMTLFLAGCSNNSKVVMTIKEGTLTNTGATIVIKDNKQEENTYGDWYRIDVYEDGEWKEAPTVIDDYNFNMIGYLTDETKEIELKTNWEDLYGKLKPGKYRIVKKLLDDSEIYAEFNIE